MTDTRTLSGQVRFTEPVAPGGTLRVRVEDVSRADAPAQLVAEAHLPVDHALAAGESLDFLLQVPAVDERIHYAVRVHLDEDGSGALASGDRISMQAYPVLTGGHPDQIVVEARRI